MFLLLADISFVCFNFFIINFDQIYNINQWKYHLNLLYINYEHLMYIQFKLCIHRVSGYL